jgi:hypothetical protein
MSLGAIGLANGVLYVAHTARRTHVQAFDWDGHALAPAFAPRGNGGESICASALAVDCDRRLWLLDAPGERALAFTLHGRACGEIRSQSGVRPATLDLHLEDARDRPAGLWGAASLAARDTFDDSGLGESQIWIGCRPRRRHALQAFDLSGQWLASLSSEGRRGQFFDGLSSLSWSRQRLWVAETGAARLQVFDARLEHHASFALASHRGERLRPTALCALETGGCVVAARGECEHLLLLDRHGKVERELATSGRPRTSDGQRSSDLQHVVGLVAESQPGRSLGRVAVLDLDGERVQVFSLEGRCQGALPALPGNLAQPGGSSRPS